jgi:hypothetical protein
MKMENEFLIFKQLLAGPGAAHQPTRPARAQRLGGLERERERAPVGGARTAPHRGATGARAATTRATARSSP